MPLQKARLTLDADVDDDGTAETGIFDFEGNLEVTPGLRTGYLIGGQGSTVNSVVSSTVGDGQSKRKGVYVDLGGGTRTVEVQFRGWSGSPGQWGDGSGGTGRDNVTKADATDADPLSQMDVLMQYLTVGEIDSRNPATLAYGEHSDGGVYEPLDVVVEQPQLTRSAQDGQWFDGSMTFLSAVDLREAFDGAKRKVD